MDPLIHHLEPKVQPHSNQPIDQALKPTRQPTEVHARSTVRVLVSLPFYYSNPVIFEILSARYSDLAICYSDLVSFRFHQLFL
jgi:hypothetical protein